MTNSSTQTFYFLLILKCLVLCTTGGVANVDDTGEDGKIGTDDPKDDTNSSRELNASGLKDDKDSSKELNANGLQDEADGSKELEATVGEDNTDGSAEQSNHDPKKDVENFPLDQIDHGMYQNGFSFNDKEMEKFKIWPNGVIPYFIDDYSYDKILRDKIRKFLGNAASRTGLQFVELATPPKDERKRWVFFINRRAQLECSDYTINNFTTEGIQKVVLGYDCITPVNMAAMLLTLLSVPPQHNAPDRDKKICIIWKNILPNKKHLFKALENQDWLFHNLPYDYNSAGHYDIFKYTANGGQTISPMNPDLRIVALSGLSEKDVRKIKMMYNYIIHNKPQRKLSECSKLYKPGPDFHNQMSIVPKKIKPLDKPSKYLENNEDVHTESKKIQLKDTDYQTEDNINVGAHNKNLNNNNNDDYDDNGFYGNEDNNHKDEKDDNDDKDDKDENVDKDDNNDDNEEKNDIDYDQDDEYINFNRLRKGNVSKLLKFPVASNGGNVSAPNGLKAKKVRKGIKSRKGPKTRKGPKVLTKRVKAALNKPDNEN